MLENDINYDIKKEKEEVNQKVEQSNYLKNRHKNELDVMK